MKLRVTVESDEADTWFKGTKDERAVRNLLLRDAEPYLGTKFGGFLEYTLTREEMDKIAPGALVDKAINVAVKMFKPGQGGRTKIQGALDLSGLPKASATA